MSNNKVRRGVDSKRRMTKPVTTHNLSYDKAVEAEKISETMNWLYFSESREIEKLVNSSAT